MILSLISYYLVYYSHNKGKGKYDKNNYVSYNFNFFVGVVHIASETDSLDVIQDKVIFLDEIQVSPKSDNQPNFDSSGVNSSVLVFELKSSFNFDVYWITLVEVSGGVSDQNIDVLLDLYRTHVKREYYELKLDFVNKTGISIYAMDLYSATPNLTVHLNEVIDSVSDIPNEYVDAISDESVSTVAVILVLV